MKRLLTLTTAGIFLFASGAAAATISFRDVPQDHWAKEFIDVVVGQGVMTGPGNRPEYFEPNGTVNRAQLAKVTAELLRRIEYLERAIGVPPPPTSQPPMTLRQQRNAQRRSDVNTIINAVYQYAIDNNKIPESIRSTETEICTSGNTTCTGVNLSLLEGAYIIGIPKDPSLGRSAKMTGYTIIYDGDGRITVRALKAEDEEISVTR